MAKTIVAGKANRGYLTSAGSPARTGSAYADFDIAQDQRRIKDVESARSIYNRFVQDNVLRSQTIATTRNQLEGGRPFDPKLLEEQGASWQTNINFGDAQAARDRTLMPYWSMVHDVPHAIAVTIDSTSPRSGEWQVAFAETFDEFRKDWGADYQIQYMNFASNFVNFGPGIVQWEHEDCPRFSAVNTQRTYFPKNARMSPDSWDVVAMVRDVSASELYLKIKDKKAKRTYKDAGWNLDAVEACIVQTMYGNSKRDPRDATRWQDDLVQNDITISSIFEPLQLVWMFARQFDGRISCRVFTVQAGVDDFLFSADDYADDFRHLLGCVWYDTGVDSMVHSIKGFGIKNYYFSMLLNRMKSRMTDAATLAFGINLFRADDTVPDEAPPVENYGPFTVFPSGLQQFPIYPDLKNGMSVVEALDQNRAENSALYRQQQTQQIQESDTATQANLLASMAGQMSEASASVYLVQVGENIFAECVRRLRKKGSADPDAKKFVARLVQKGVPKDVIYNADLRVETGANSGMANPVLRAQKFQQMLAMMNIPGVNGRWILEQFFAETLGATSVEKALLPLGVNSQPMQRREAMIENAQFGQGMQLPVDPSDAHFEHAQEHLVPLQQIAAQYKAKNDLTPEQLSALIIGIEHTGQHMSYLAKDDTMKAQYQQVWPQFSMIQSIARGIIARMQKQPAQGGPTNGSPMNGRQMAPSRNGTPQS